MNFSTVHVCSRNIEDMNVMESYGPCLWCELICKYMGCWLFQLSQSPSPKSQNFEQFQKWLKFCGKLLKGPKAKPKVYKIYQNFVSFCLIKYCNIFLCTNITIIYLFVLLPSKQPLWSIQIYNIFFLSDATYVSSVVIWNFQWPRGEVDSYSQHFYFFVAHE